MTKMDRELLKKALPKGILAGVCLALVYVLIRLLLNGGNFFEHLFSVYGILTLICVPVAWVSICYNKEKDKQKK